MKNTVAKVLLHRVSSMEATLLAPIGSPPLTSLITKFVLISSSSYLPIFLKKDYGIKLIIAPPSTSIYQIGVPSRCPWMYNGFKWFFESFAL
jgi:hypothetical protein